MLQFGKIKELFEQSLPSESKFDKHILKEYMQLMILDYLSKSKYAEKLVFIGGTSLRIVFDIPRFSEDLDFDCKNLSREEFTSMTNDVIEHLSCIGYNVSEKLVKNQNLNAYRRNITFPELLYKEGLSPHKEELFLIKIEAEDQGVDYCYDTHIISKAGFYFPITTPSIDVLCSMKFSAFLNRNRGRDIYDLMFLLGVTKPNMPFLAKKCGIPDEQTLWNKVLDKLSRTDLNHQLREFEHMLFRDSDKNSIFIFEKMAELELSEINNMKEKKIVARSKSTQKNGRKI